MQSVVQVDAFAERAFTGNPAAVCVLEEALEPVTMQAIAAEMNLSETAFLQARPGGWDLRWFTPVAEVDLCGHATLASAHALWETGRAAADAVLHFHTRSGVLTAVQRGEWIELDFPALGGTEIPAPDWLEAALGTRPERVFRGPFDYLVEIGSEQAVRVNIAGPVLGRPCGRRQIHGLGINAAFPRRRFNPPDEQLFLPEAASAVGHGIAERSPALRQHDESFSLLVQITQRIFDVVYIRWLCHHRIVYFQFHAAYPAAVSAYCNDYGIV
jgi:hypothetical protein